MKKNGAQNCFLFFFFFFFFLFKSSSSSSHSHHTLNFLILFGSRPEISYSTCLSFSYLWLLSSMASSIFSMCDTLAAIDARACDEVSGGE